MLRTGAVKLIVISIDSIVDACFHCRLSAIAENVVLSLNEEYLDLDNQELRLRAGDELAIIPPISGG